MCQDESYVPAAEVATFKEQAWAVLRLLNGYLRWLRAQKQGQTLSLREAPAAYGNDDADLESWLASLPLEPGPKVTPM